MTSLPIAFASTRQPQISAFLSRSLTQRAGGNAWSRPLQNQRPLPEFASFQKTVVLRKRGRSPPQLSAQQHEITASSSSRSSRLFLSMAGRGVNGAVEDPSTEQEEALLEAFANVSSIDKAWCRVSLTGPPAPKNAKGPPAKFSLDVSVLMSQRNLPGNTTRKFLSSAFIPEPQGDLSLFHWAPFPSELSGVSLAVPSPSSERLLLIRNAEQPARDGSAAAAAVRLEIWGAGRLLKEVHVPPSLHGSVYTDGLFEGVSWSADESAIAYVAEQPPPARPVFGRSKPAAAAPAAAAAPPVGRGRFASAGPVVAKAEERSSEEVAGSWKGRGELQEDWGEKYTGKGRPLLFVLDVASGTVAAVEGIPEDVSAGQVVWAPPAAGSPVQTTLIFVGWPSFSSNFQTPKRLGIAYCSNRPSALYAVEAPGEDGVKSGPAAAVKISGAISSAFAPRFSPDGAVLVFLSAAAAVESGTHGATNSLQGLPWPAEGLPLAPPPKKGAPNTAPEVDLAVQTIIDVVGRSEDPSGFPGLYASSLISQPWLADGRTLLLTTAWRSTQAIIAVHVETGRVSRLTPEGPISWSLLDVKNNIVIAGASTPACPTKLMLGRINAGWLKQEGWLWSEISPPHVEYPEEVESALKSAEFEILQITPATPKGRGAADVSQQAFEAIFVRRQPDLPPAPAVPAGKVAPAPPPIPPQPLLVIPHGGPHAVTSTTFIMPYAYLCALGYSILHVNYRGSLGFGEEALQSLPGQIGSQDVEDVLEAVERALELGYADPDRIAVIGGSHGGFLAAHLIGQEPDRFRTAILRNPVCNIAAMSGETDISDWCFVEALGSSGLQSFTEAPSEADLAAFYKASPIQYVDKVKVPTLFFLGGNDRRVPPSNGLQFANALKARDLDVKVVMFPEDAHGIEKPQSEFEQWFLVASWLKKYL